MKERYIRQGHIHDFVISDDTVFFCGENIYGTGFIGFFDINNFFNNNGEYYLIDTLPICDGYYAAKLKKLVTYHDDNNIGNIRHVFAIGYTDHNDTHEKYGCVIDLMSDAGYRIYNAGYVYKSTENLFTDVTEIGKYVVTVGYTQVFGVDVRVFYKNNPLQPSGIQNFVHRIEGNLSNGLMLWNEVDALVTSVPDLNPSISSNISVASIYKKQSDSDTINWSILLAELNVNSIVSHSFNTILNSRRLYSYDFLLPLKLRELRYNRSNMRHSILYKGGNNSGTNVRNLFVEMSKNYDSTVVAFRDFTSSFNDTISLISFDMYKNNKYILAGDSDFESLNIDLTDELILDYETSGHNSYCLPNVKCNLVDETDVKATYEESKIKSIGQRANLQQFTHCNVIYYSIDTECTSGNND